MLSIDQKYHLPHNAVRVDEFKFMLDNIDLNKEFYTYEELKLSLIQKQIEKDKFKVFHSGLDKKLRNHPNHEFVELYNKCINNPSETNIKELFNHPGYTPRKNFKQIFNETARDYTEFFAFLGLLPTYYKGRLGGENRHYVSQRLKDYRNRKIDFNRLIFDFKFRNSSKDYESLEIYQIFVRPYVLALKACKHYFDKGFSKVNALIVSAIVLYSKNENESFERLLTLFPDPEKNISSYKSVFNPVEYDSIVDELGRARLQLRPYLLESKYLNCEGGFYIKGEKEIVNAFADNVAFCNSHIGNLAITPIVGKILYKLYDAAYHSIHEMLISDLFDSMVSKDDINFLLSELINLGCIIKASNGKVELAPFYKQVSINPYTEFYSIADSNYVSCVSSSVIRPSGESLTVDTTNREIENELSSARPVALGSDGTLYERTLFNILNTHFSRNFKEIKWYGANATGRRLSDIFINATIRDGGQNKKIAIIIECKAGRAIRSFDERKEVDDIKNTLQLEDVSRSYDGVWYWVVDSDQIPSIDQHGGYRANSFSRTFMEKLSLIQFEVSETVRVPTIVTAFSFDAIKNYISYLFSKVGTTSINVINSVNVPHFWKWSRKFMYMQYVMVHRELTLSTR